MKLYFKNIKKAEKLYKDVKNDYMFKDYTKDECFYTLYNLIEQKIK